MALKSFTCECDSAEDSVLIRSEEEVNGVNDFWDGLRNVRGVKEEAWRRLLARHNKRTDVGKQRDMMDNVCVLN